MDKSTETFELMSKMYSEILDMKADMNKLSKKIDTGFNELTERIDKLSNGLGKMVTNEVADELSSQLDEIKKDVKFVKHKVRETEEDVFTIQSHLKIIK